MTTDVLVRLVDEYADLRKRIDKLWDFVADCEIPSVTTPALREGELEDLKLQLDHMRAYRDVLRRRIVRNA